MRGMTLKQFARRRFFEALENYRCARNGLLAGAPGAQEAFIRASVQVHASKGGVPKRLWPLVNKED